MPFQLSRSKQLGKLTDPMCKNYTQQLSENRTSVNLRFLTTGRPIHRELKEPVQELESID